MAEEKNVGQLDSIIRIVLGFGIVVLVAMHFMGESTFPLYGLIAFFILIPFFLKTGFSKVCPIMKAMNLSTLKKTEG